jgi:hypothetical protein
LTGRSSTPRRLNSFSGASGILNPRFRGDEGWCAGMTAAACGKQGH